MQKLATKLKQSGAIIRPASEIDIQNAENLLNINFSNEYRNYLTTFGIISLESTETFGLGIPNSSYLNIIEQISDFKKLGDKTPPYFIPLSDFGDGYYYFYDNSQQRVIIWSSPNGGIVKVIDKNLEDFLIELFSL